MGCCTPEILLLTLYPIKTKEPPSFVIKIIIIIIILDFLTSFYKIVMIVMKECNLL